MDPGRVDKVPELCRGGGVKHSEDQGLDCGVESDQLSLVEALLDSARIGRRFVVLAGWVVTTALATVRQLKSSKVRKSQSVVH